MAKSRNRSIRLRPDQEAAIEKIVARDKELKRSSIIRRAIDEYLEKRGEGQEDDVGDRPYGDKKIVPMTAKRTRSRVSYSGGKKQARR